MRLGLDRARQIAVMAQPLDAAIREELAALAAWLGLGSVEVEQVVRGA